MHAECLLDTSVLVYAVSSAPAEAARKRRAVDLVQRTDFGLSAEGLREFYVTVTRRIRKPLAPPVAIALMDEFRVFPLVPTDFALMAAAAEFSLRYGMAFRDGAALAAARALGASTIYTDALPPGGDYGAVEVVNPFA